MKKNSLNNLNFKINKVSPSIDILSIIFIIILIIILSCNKEIPQVTKILFLLVF